MARAATHPIERDLRALANPKRATALQWFFKTGRGEYGEGDTFLGLTMPQVRQLARTHAAASLKDIERLLDSSWHEARTLALVLMVNQYAKAGEPARRAIYRLYLARTDRINNWDLVDVSAPGVVGAHLLTRQRGVLRRLARSRNLWERRIAMVSTAAFIRKDQFDDTLALAEMLLRDTHDLMHKAVGWMLREVGKRDEPTLIRFLDRHAARMPRTALRYALERLTPRQRLHYMTLKRA